jgi:protein-disulfide isomerase
LDPTAQEARPMSALSSRLLVALLSAAAISAPAFAQPAASPAPASAPNTAPPATAPAVAMPAPRMTAPEYRMGNPKAKVTVIEYASDTCPHCARFAAEVFPAFKAKYVDTGQVLYIFREFPTDPAQLSAAGFVMARCAGEAKYFDVVNALFKAQPTAKSGLDFLMAGAKVGGLSEDQVKACLDNPAGITDLNARVQNAVNVEKIDSTPTLIVNDKKLNNTTEITFKDLDAAIAPLLAPTTSKAVQKHH